MRSRFTLPVYSTACPEYLRPALLRAATFLLASLVLAPCLAADELSFFASRRLLSEADSALAAERLDAAADLYTQVVNGTDSGKPHTRALLGAAVAELAQRHADTRAARRHLAAYLADPSTEDKGVARALLKLLDNAEKGSGHKPPPRPRTPPPEEPRGEPSDMAEAEARIADLERQLAEAQQSIAEKEKLIEDLRKIVVEGGG